MKYLITDPCYTMSHENWDDLLRSRGYEAEDWVGVITNHGTIIEASSTTYGDGSCKVGDYEIGVDSGTVCMIEVPDNYKHEDNFGAVTADKATADRWYAKAKQI